MKRKLLVMGLIISSLVLADEFKDNNKNEPKGQIKGMEMPVGNQSNLTEAQKKELKSLIEKQQKTLAPLILTLEEKDLGIKKELLADKVNWEKVDSILKEKAVIEGQIEVSMLKNRVEIQDKFGDIFKFEMGNMMSEKGPQMNGNFDSPKMDGQEKDMKKMSMQGNEMKNDKFMDKKDGMKDNVSNEMLNLSETQKSDMKLIKDKYQKQISILRLSEEEKEIAIRKEMLEDKTNWTKIEGLTKDKSLIHEQLELLILQERDEIKTKLGIEFIQGFGKDLQGKFNPDFMGKEKI